MNSKKSSIWSKAGVVVFVCLLLAVLSTVFGCDSTGLYTADRTLRIAEVKREAAIQRAKKIRLQRRAWANRILAE